MKLFRIIPKVSSVLILLGLMCSVGIFLPAHSVYAFNPYTESTFDGLLMLFNAIESVGDLGAFLLGIISNFLGSVASVGSFVTNPYVTSGWPFLQGLANFGFILALLVIAATTALRIDIGGGARRLLPRLLLGAILINFSLLIAGLLIDVSRLLMALFASILGSGGFADIGPDIMRESSIVGNVYDVIGGNDSLDVNYINQDYDNSADLIGRMLKANIFIWGIMIAMLVITVTLIIRYIMLLLLLIVSPLVYVAIAFPGASGLASKWWSKFLREVFYGPIAIFALVLLGTVGPGEGSFGGGLNPFVLDVLGLVIMIVMLFVVATSGRQWGATGANFALNATKGTGNLIRRHPYLAGGAAYLAGGPAAGILGLLAARLGYQGGRRAVTGVANAGRDFKNTAISTAADRARSGKAFGAFGKATGLSKLAKSVAGPKRDDKGKLKKGESTLVSRLGERLGSPAKYKEKTEAIKAGKDASKVIGNDPTRVPAALSVGQLTNPNTTEALSKDAYAAALQSPDPNQIKAVVAGTTKQQKVSKEQAKNLVVTLYNTASSTNPSVTTADKTLAKEMLEEVLRQQKIVNKLDDTETSNVFSLNDTKLNKALLRTLAKEDKE